ncbi:MAG: YggS family pyridoxal phosphate-dependent enzyme [Deltaproteobacteria bacterium]|nr:YggS family pyridoxal phosphate-dependent enzyme [Deltaproteobacteria bacterium]MBN2687348.1 YggS family pyridoxal phosphate-dependent enzyme [Deltaproteobacteria bacterium]
MSSVADNIRKIRDDIVEAARRAHRDPSGVRLMGVTKTVDDQRIDEAIRTGLDIIGENYVQEGKRKIEAMGKTLEWHLIGHLQTNKCKYAVRLFDMIHSVDRLKLARELDKRAGIAGTTMDILVEVNVSGEESKSGVTLQAALPLIREISTFEHIKVKGLMTMPPWFDDPEDARPYFVDLRKLGARIAKENIPGVEMKELSMGMSQDYRVAVEEGATIVRIGTAIFGERSYV